MKKLLPTQTFRAFHNRNYAIFFCGQSVSQIGTWMQRTAVSWVIYSISHSAFMLGFAVFAQSFPSFLLSLLGGIVYDRYPRYKILLITQTASMIQAILLALLIYTNHYVIWEILALAVLLGIINAFDVPARQPMIHEMIADKEDLANAFALNASMTNTARILGPALSGLALQQFGAATCFGLNALSFVAVLTSLLLMKFNKDFHPRTARKPLSDLADGFRYLRDTPKINTTLLLLIFISLLVIPYDTLIPIFAKVVFHGDAATYGYISSFMGAGAIIGTFFIASLKKGTDLRKMLFGAGMLQCVGLILFSRIANYPVAMVFAVIAGLGGMSQNTICIALIQTESAPEMRGRTMSFIALSYFGMVPLGSLLVGSVSQHLGAQNTMFCQGILAGIIAIGFTFFVRRSRLKEKEQVIMEEAEELVITKV